MSLVYKLYYSPGACSLAAHIVLKETGEAFELKLVSSAGEAEGRMTSKSTWHAVNPKGRIPALSPVLGTAGGADGVLTELTAILFFLARSHPHARLLPKDAAGEARCVEWMNWLSSNVHAMSFGEIWRPHRFISDTEQWNALRERGMQSVLEQYAYIERLLSDGRDWAVPGQYSIVDPYLLVFYVWGRRVGIAMTTYSSWTCLMERVSDRPAVDYVMRAEGIPSIRQIAG